jgi:hypothetical protein
MGNINDMIINIAQGDLAKAQADFNDVMSAKVADRLQQQQAYIARETFTPSDDEEEGYEDIFDESEQDDDDYEGEYDYEEGDEDLLDDEGYEEDE